MKTKSVILMVAGLGAVLFTGCEPAAQSGRGFTLPAGDVEKGRAAFVDLKCTTCHIVQGVGGLPPPGETVTTPVVIGGEVARAKTYGQLVTAIIHPSHQITGQLRPQWEEWSKLSPMPDYGEIMTVRQMTDLVTFLQPQYIKLEPLYDSHYYP